MRKMLNESNLNVKKHTAEDLLRAIVSFDSVLQQMMTPITSLE